jgi:hypothetical protein
MYCSSAGKYYGGEEAAENTQTADRCYKQWVNTKHKWDLAMCPSGSVIIGIKTKVDPFDPIEADNTGLEEIQFLCDGVKVETAIGRIGQGHLVEGEDSDTFFSLLWSEICN